MCDKERTVKVKSYDSDGITFAPFIIVVSVFCAIVFLLLVINLDKVYEKLIMGGVGLTFFVIIPIILFIDAFVFYNIDIFSESGIKRVKGKKVIFEVKWENVKEMIYFGAFGVIGKVPFCIGTYTDVKLTEHPRFKNLSLDTKTFWTPVKLKQLIEIMEIAPVEIVIDNVTKRRIERYKKKLAKKENKEKSK